MDEKTKGGTMKRNEYLKILAGITLFFLFSALIFYFYSNVLEKRKSLKALIKFCKQDSYALDEKEREKLKQNFEQLTGFSGYLYLNIFHPLANFRIRKDIEKLQRQFKIYEKLYNDWMDTGTKAYFIFTLFKGVENYKKLNVLIYERFDSDNKGRGFYNAVDMTHSKKIVVVGKPKNVLKYLTGTYHKLYLQFLGEFKYRETYSNGYSTYNKTVYYETYKLLEDQKVAEDLLKAYKKKKKEIEKMQQDFLEKDTELKNFVKNNINPLKNDILRLLGEK